MREQTAQRAGWSQVEITPPLGIHLGGRGMLLSAADQVKAPLVGQALVLEDNRGMRLVLVSVDLVELSTGLAARLQCQLAAVAGVLPESVIINCSHTHSGPFTCFEDFASLLPKQPLITLYEQRLEDWLTLAVEEAVARLQPATVAHRVGWCDAAINRRRTTEDGRIAMLPNAGGNFNPEVLVLEIVQTGSGASCIAFSYACHPIMDCGASATLISPDYPGVVRETVREALGEGTHVQFFQAACGDVRPRILAEGERFRPCQPEDAATVGSAVAGALLRALQRAPRMLTLRLAAVEGWMSLPMDAGKRPSREALAAMSEAAGATGAAVDYWLESGLDRQGKAVAWPWNAGLFSLTETCRIAWISSEPLSGWQGFLRTELNDPDLILWGYVGKSLGYLPMDDALAAGGYEAEMTILLRMGPGPIAQGVNAIVARLFRNLQKRLAERM